MLKTESRVIDGETYSLQQMGGWQALRLQHRLAGAIGPALGKMAANAGDVGVMGDALGELASRMPSAEWEQTVKELLWSLRKGNQDVSPTSKNFEFEFAGKTLTVLKLVWFALEVNFSDFFDAWRGFARPAPQAQGSGESTT